MKHGHSKLSGLFTLHLIKEYTLFTADRLATIQKWLFQFDFQEKNTLFSRPVSAPPLAPVQKWPLDLEFCKKNTLYPRPVSTSPSKSGRSGLISKKRIHKDHKNPEYEKMMIHTRTMQLPIYFGMIAWPEFCSSSLLQQQHFAAEVFCSNSILPQESFTSVS